MKKPSLISRDCPRWLYETLRSLESGNKSSSEQLAAVDRGEQPTGGGAPLGGVIDHGLLLGLVPDDDHTQYALLRGRPAGQTLHGSIGSGGTGSVSDGGPFTQQVLGATSALTWTVSIDHSVAANKLIILLIGTGGNDGNPTAGHNSITDTQGNSWVKVDQKSFDRGNVGAPERFISISIWYCQVTNALTLGSDTLLVTFGGNVANKTCEGRWFNATAGSTVSIAGDTTGFTDQNSPADPLVDLVLSLSIGTYLFIRADAIADNNTAYTASSGFTEFYSGHTNSTTSNGTLYNNVGTRGEFDIATNNGLTATGPTINLTNLPIAASMMIAIQLIGGTPGILTLESGDDSLSSIIELHGSTITSHFDFFNFEAIGGSSVLSYIRGSDGAFVGPVVMSPAVHLLNTSLFDDVTAGAAARGDLITGQTGTPKWTKLAVGTANQYLGTDGTDVLWRAQSTIDHGSLGGLADDDHAQYLLLAGRSGGQVIGSGSHTSGNSTDLVIENRLMLGDSLSGVNYTTGRVLDIRHAITNGATHINIQPVLTGLSGVASGTLTGLQIAMTGTPGYTSGSFTERGFFFTATIVVPTGVTLTEGLGGLFQTALSTINGTVTKLTGLRSTTLGSNLSANTITSLLGFDINLGGRSSNITNLSALNFSANSTIGASVTTFKLIDAANTGATALGDSAAVTTWSGLYIPTLANPGTIWLLDLGNNNSRLTGKTRFGGSTAPTNPVSITGAADISGIFDFTGAPRLANGVWLTAFNSIAGTVNLLRYTTGNNTELNSANSIDFIVAGGGSFRFTATTGILDMTSAGGGILLKAGTTTAYPLRFQSGTNLTAATTGVLEYDGTFFYATEGTPTRRKIVLADGAAAGSIIYGDASGNHFLKLTNGTAGQVLLSGGGTAAPAWTTPAWTNSDIVNRTRYWWINSTMFQASPAQAERGAGDGVYTGILMNGATDSEVSGWFVVPVDFVSLTSIQIAWASIGTSTNNAVWRIGYKVQVASDDLTSPPSTADTTVTPTSSADILFLTTLNLTSETLTAGSLVRITIQRRASNDAGDTNTDSLLFAGLKFTYTADM